MSRAANQGNDDLIGTTIAGRYRITSPLGTGAMGAVYRADDVERGTPIAIKVLRDHLSGIKEAGVRFQREGLVGARIVHPNCVAVSDFGTAETGEFYLAMELVEGESLGDLLDRERILPWRRALHIARHVLRGLGHAHRESVVHRDIKPDNIFIVRRGKDPDFARVLDFGIAKLIGDAAQSAITQAGIAIGTPKYLSPEQAMGGTIDGRSDLYSLSIVLYEMLTGRTPFGDLEPLKTLFAHATAPVPTFAEIAPDVVVPPEVESLVRDGLAKQADERIGTAAEYVARIDALLGSGSRRRRRRVLVAVAVAMVAVVLGAAAYLHQSASSSALPTVATPAPGPIDAALRTLEQGKTCAERRSAVDQLRTIGDPAAIPALEKARSRPRHGKNTNACLTASADAAISALSTTAKAN